MSQKQPEKRSAQHKDNGLPFVDEIKDVYIWLNKLLLDFFKSSDKNENCVGCQKKTVIVTKNKQWKTSDLMHHTLDRIFCIYSYANKCRNSNFVKRCRKKKRKIEIAKWKYRKLVEHKQAGNLAALRNLATERTEKQPNNVVLVASDQTNYDSSSSQLEISAAALLEHQAQTLTDVHSRQGSNLFYKVSAIFRLKSKNSAFKKTLMRTEEMISNFDEFTYKDVTCQKKYKAFERIHLGRHCYFNTPMLSLICSFRKQFRNRAVSGMNDNSRSSDQELNTTSAIPPISSGTLTKRIVVREGSSNKYFEHIIMKNFSIYYLPSNHSRCRQPVSVKREEATENIIKTSSTSKAQILKIYTDNRYTFHPLSNLLSLKCQSLHTKKRVHEVKRNTIVKNDAQVNLLKTTKSLLNDTQKHEKSIKSREEVFSLISLYFLLVCKNPNMKDRTSQVPLKIPQMSEDEYKLDRSSEYNKIIKEPAVHVDDIKTNMPTNSVNTVIKDGDRNEIDIEEAEGRFSSEDIKNPVSVKGAESTLSSEESKSSTLILNTESKTVLLGGDEIAVQLMETEIKPSFSSMEHRQSTKTLALSDEKKIKQTLMSQVTQKSSISDTAKSVHLDYMESKKPKKDKERSHSASTPNSAITESAPKLRSAASNSVVQVDQLVYGRSSLLLSPIQSITLAEDVTRKQPIAHMAPTTSLEMSKSSLALKASKSLTLESKKNTFISKHEQRISRLEFMEGQSSQKYTENAAVPLSQLSVTSSEHRKESAGSILKESTASEITASPSVVSRDNEDRSQKERTLLRARTFNVVIDKSRISSKKVDIETKNLDVEMPQAKLDTKERNFEILEQKPKPNLKPNFGTETATNRSAILLNVKPEKQSKTQSFLTPKGEACSPKGALPQQTHDSTADVKRHRTLLKDDVIFESKNLDEEIPKLIQSVNEKDLVSTPILELKTTANEHQTSLKVQVERSSKIIPSSYGTGPRIDLSVVPDTSATTTTTKIEHIMKSIHLSPRYRIDTEITPQLKSVTANDNPRTSADVIVSATDTERKHKVMSKEPLKSSYSGAVSSEKMKTEGLDESGELLARSTSILVNIERQYSMKSTDKIISDANIGLSESISLSRMQSQNDATLKLERSETEKKNHKSRDETVVDIDQSFRHPFEPTKSLSETERIVVKKSNTKTTLKESDRMSSKTNGPLLETGIQRSLNINDDKSARDIESFKSPYLAVKSSQLSKDNITRTELKSATKQSKIDEKKKVVMSTAMKVIKSGDPLPYHAQPSTMAVSEKKSVEDLKEGSGVSESAGRQDIKTSDEMNKKDNSFDDDGDKRPDREKEIEEGKKF